MKDGAVQRGLEEGLTQLLKWHSLGTIYTPWDLLDGQGAERHGCSRAPHLST